LASRVLSKVTVEERPGQGWRKPEVGAGSVH